MVRTLEGRRQAVKVVADVAGLAEQHAVVAAPVLADLAYCVCAHMPVQKNSSSSRSQRSTCITRQRSGIVDRRRGGGEAAQPARSRGAGLSPQLARNEPRSPCHPRTTRARPAWVHEAQAMQEQMRRHVLGRGAVCRCGRRHYVAAPAVPNRFHRRAAQGPSRQAEVVKEGI